MAGMGKPSEKVWGGGHTGEEEGFENRGFLGP